MSRLPQQAPRRKKKIAVIGSGISGLSAAWFLGQEHSVTLFEKEKKLGGHTNTVNMHLEGQNIAVDTGFIVFNLPNYPNLGAMFRHLGVLTEPTDMSFSVSVNDGELEYAGSNLNTLFAQRRNLFSPQHWSMIREIMRFNNQAKANLSQNTIGEVSLTAYLDEYKFSQRLRDYYLLPMGAAIWSCPVERMGDFPAQSFLQFFENHGLLNVADRPQWETVHGGAQHYIDAIVSLDLFKVRVNAGVHTVAKTDMGVMVETLNGEFETFDEVVFACHADQAYRMMNEDLKAHFAPLQHFTYQENIAYLHQDENLMPVRKKAWSSWNYLRDTSDNQAAVAVTYWMNQLQNLPTKKPIFVTLNPQKPPLALQTEQRIVYQHPVFDTAAMASQPKLKALQGQQNIWLCGSYMGYGFHEDGITSSVELAKLWGIDLPWQAKKVHRLDENNSVDSTLKQRQS